jgi:hypothetical protein
MECIGTAFGMEFVGGKSLFTADTPKAWKGKLENWAWDYFNLYFYEFKFGGNNNTWLSVILQSDTGLWDIIDNNEDYWDIIEEKQDKIDLFNSPEDSKTRLFFVTGNGKWSENKIQILLDKNPNKNIKNEDVLEKGNGKIWYKIFEINKFIDEETRLKTFNEFIDFLNCKEFDKIKIIKKGSSC